MRDLELLKARFITCEFSKEDEYLKHYFPDTPRQKLVIYYKLFPYHGVGMTKFHKNFTDHTGVHCCLRWIYKTLRAMKIIEKTLSTATAQTDLAMITLIKSGQFAKKKKVQTLT